MQYRNLGNTGLKVSRICFGCMSFGRWIDEATSRRIVDECFAGGINFFDTADVYGTGMDNGDHSQKGEAEEILGRALKGRRHQIVLATKVHGAMGDGPNDKGLSRGHIMQAVEASLRRLQTDHLDLYQVHNFDPETPQDETLRALDDLVRQGKVRYIGCSNHQAWQIARAHGISARLGLERYESVQPQYSIIHRDPEAELLPFALAEKVGVIVYSPIGRGILAGKYKAGELPPADSRLAKGEARIKQLMSERALRVAEALRPLAAERRITPAQFAVAWVLSHPAVTSAIIGASKVEQLQESLGAVDIALTPDEMARVDRICAET